jgi:putative acetyltransferase
MSEFVVGIDDPQSAEVEALLDQHLAFARRHTPPEDVHALDISGLLADDVSFFSLRQDGELLGIGALKQVEEAHAEIKSMYTAEAARRRGVGRAMVDHLLGIARSRGCGRVSLETGAMTAFAPARALYASAGFEPCGPFADYGPSPNSVYMTLELNQPHRPGSSPDGAAAS